MLLPYYQRFMGLKQVAFRVSKVALSASRRCACAVRLLSPHSPSQTETLSPCVWMRQRAALVPHTAAGTGAPICGEMPSPMKAFSEQRRTHLSSEERWVRGGGAGRISEETRDLVVLSARAAACRAAEEAGGWIWHDVGGGGCTGESAGMEGNKQPDPSVE